MLQREQNRKKCEQIVWPKLHDTEQFDYDFVSLKP